MRSLRRGTFICAALLVSACAASDPGDLELEDWDAIGHDELADYEDLDEYLQNFDQHHLVSDDAFFDSGAMTATEVQSFLEATPYGKRSFLADEIMEDGETTFAEALVATGTTHRINPLILLATVQKEASLISKSKRPSSYKVNYAFGCGCHDGSDCLRKYRGLDKQLDCVADVLTEAEERLRLEGKTLTGWRPGRVKSTLDPKQVNPANRATAILYTYTPWVLPRTGGNWLFWAIWTKYAKAIEYGPGLSVPFNEGFIGGSCSTADDCFFDDAQCMAGICIKECDRFCPDRPGSHFATTFCVDAGQERGWCAAQCSDQTECGPDQACVDATRQGEPSKSANICYPEL